MAASTARRDQAAEMGFEEAEIKRRMGEIADWLRVQPEAPPAPPPAARLQVIAEEVAPAADGIAEPAEANDNSLDAILQRRLAARRARAQDEAGAYPLREVMGRFAGPIDTTQSAEHTGFLRAAVAEIVERQRLLDDAADIQADVLDDAPIASPAAEEAAPTGLESAFEKLAAQFETRTARSFEALESSLADVRRLIAECQTPVEAAEATAARVVQERLQTFEAETHGRIDEVAHELAELRSDASDSERRTRDLLDAVRQTLEHVAARLPERNFTEAAPASDPDATSRARAAALRAMEESIGVGDPDLAAMHTPSASPERRRFIAAARRSARSADEPLAPTAKYQKQAAPQPRANRADAIAANSLVQPKRRMGSIRHILLTGAAAAALLVGIYAGSSRLLDSVLSGNETAASSSEEIPAAEPATVAEAPVQAAETPPPALSEPPTRDYQEATPAFDSAAEPAVTGSIPEPLPALDPLPPEIGGSRLRTRAVAGDAAAQYEVAIRFAEGRGVARNAEKAAAWMERAALQGLAPAQFRYASFLEKGTGLTMDLQAARGFYEKAAAAGNTQAMHNLGVLHAEGGLGQSDMAVALVWFRKAAEYGVKDSQYNLGIFYARGLSVPPNLAESYLWFSLAAAQGDHDGVLKRDQIAAKLDAAKVQAMKVAADVWQPKTAPAGANQVAPPTEGWDDAATGRASTATPKAKAN